MTKTRSARSGRYLIGDYNGGEYVGIDCKHCPNRADVVLVRGPESMTLCNDCAGEQS